MSEDRLRLSFDAVADVYERSRPGYADDAVDWIATRLPFARVLDLAAGTGKLTRQLAARGADVVAVEPGEAMRAVLERVVPGVRSLAGSAEEIPLPDADVDAITVGQAFHWFRTREALAEMHRVLRPGGGFALLWNEWDDEDPLLHALNGLVESLRPPGMNDRLATQREELAASPLFGPLEERSFVHSQLLDADTVVARVASVSAVAVLSQGEQADVTEQVRAAIGDAAVDFRLITSVVVGDRA
ncbi:MAG TPA: class I SAM-dependent methyltransferase [Gaiellaceae bacterium]|nr:class I SAM-dependent methyltransferase [Gaiellaceae bacterium]